jgi:hypothetical protein
MKKTPAERLGSGDGERKTLITRQIAFEPLPASVLFALVGSWFGFIAGSGASRLGVAMKFLGLLRTHKCPSNLFVTTKVTGAIIIITRRNP